MNLAIVGSQGKSFNDEQRKAALHLIELILNTWTDDVGESVAYAKGIEKMRFISGGEESGVDTWAEMKAISFGWDTRIHLPLTKNWEGFKARNILIANDADVLYAIRSRTSTTFGSGWTANYAEKLGKEVHRYYV